jgi:hypothetical protein
MSWVLLPRVYDTKSSVVLKIIMQKMKCGLYGCMEWVTRLSELLLEFEILNPWWL